MKRVLMLTYFFAPIGGGGTQRSTKFVRYLPDFGWKPYVISSPESIGGELCDETLLADIPPDVQVMRIKTPYFQPVQSLLAHFSFLKNPQVQKSAFLGSVLKMLLFPLGLLECPPVDIYFWWSLKTLPVAWRIIRREGVRLIYTSSSPFSVLLTGYLLKRLTGRPWVADIRDLWTNNELFPGYISGWRRALNVWLEAHLLPKADYILLVSPMQTLFHWGQAAVQPRCEVILNGFDSADFAESGMKAQAGEQDVILAYLGTIYQEMMPPFATAVARLCAMGRRLDHLRLYFVGENQVARDAFRGFASSGLRVFFRDRLPHRAAVDFMRGASVLLLLLPATAQGRLTPTGKIFDYMASGTPILAIVPEDGIAADLINETGTGCVVSPESTEKIIEVLELIATDYQAFRSRYFHPRPEVIRRFERRELTRKLAQVFDELAE